MRHGTVCGLSIHTQGSMPKPLTADLPTRGAELASQSVIRYRNEKQITDPI